jgi:Tol biopolymer transport system component
MITNRLRQVLFLAAMFFVYSLSGFVSAKGNEMTISRLSISPDGRTIAFQYGHPINGTSTGLLEWETGKLTTIPNPPGKWLRDANFTPDGKRLLALAGGDDTDLVSIDLATLKVTQLAQLTFSPWSPWSDPVLQPGTDKVLFVVERPYHLVQMNIKTGQVTTILEAKDGFKHVLGTPYFVGPDEIAFSAMGPQEPELRQRAESLAIREYDNIACQLRFGGRPKIILADAVDRKNDLKNPGAHFASASGDGKTMAFTALSLAHPKNEGGAYNWEIFTVRDGVVKQITDLRSYMSDARMSLDGSTFVFNSMSNIRTSSNPRFGNLHPYVLDLRSGNITPTHLVERLQQTADFNPQQERQ